MAGAVEHLLDLILEDRQRYQITENLSIEIGGHTFDEDIGTFSLLDGTNQHGTASRIAVLREDIPDLIAMLRYIQYGGIQTDD